MTPSASPDFSPRLLIRKSLLALCLALVAITAACASGSTPAESADSADESAVSSQNKSFDEMTSPEKMQHMKMVVKPKMALVFQEAAPEKYADFSCGSCHGPGAQEGDFEMPSDALPALDDEEMEEHPQITQFMKERVVPEMAALLGEEPYDRESGEGFGCYDCHTMKQ